MHIFFSNPLDYYVYLRHTVYNLSYERVYHNSVILTLSNTPSSTSRHRNAKTYLFLFSRPQLSNCRYRTFGMLGAYSCRTLSRTEMVRLLSCGISFRSTKQCCPLPCTMAPVICVSSFHAPLVDLDSRTKWGTAVLCWSIPSMITDMYFSGSLRAFVICL